MSYKRFVQGLGLGCLSILKRHAPVDSGELKASIRIHFNTDGFSLEISAPHTVYTNEKWLSPQWGGKDNKNEGWIMEAYIDICMYLQNKLTGTFDIDEDYNIEDFVGEVVIEYQNEKYGVNQ